MVRSVSQVDTISQHKTVNPGSVAIGCEGISRYFGSVRALHRVSMSISYGEIVALVGDNGAGKSTLVKVLSGNVAPDEGKIQLDGRQYSAYSMQDAQQMGIETVYQHLALCDKLTATENIVLGREPQLLAFGPLSIIDRKRARQIARQSIDDISANIPNIEAPVEKFSGGQRQAIAIARAVHAAHRLIIFDEPTAALGIKQTLATLDAIRRVADKGLAVMVIMHNLEDVYEIAHRIVALRLGSVVADIVKEDISRRDLAARMSGYE